MRAIVVGSGAGGATAARELVKRGMEVVVLEAGTRFKPFTRRVGWTEPIRRAGLLGSERNVSRFIKAYRTTRSGEELALVRSVAAGGCTVVSCGNLVRAGAGLREIGLDLTAEYEELEGQIRVSTVPRERWRPITAGMFESAKEMGLDPRPTPKAVNMERCISCGLCEVGCSTGARWDSRLFLAEAVKMGCTTSQGTAVKRVVLEAGKAVGVLAEREGRSEAIKADVVVLAAGGIGTAQILRASGIDPSDTLWADLVLTVGGKFKGARQLEEPPMAWYCQRDGYIISPYFDVLSHWFHRPWRKVGLKDRVGVMVKMAESANGKVLADGTVEKPLTEWDSVRLEKACQEVREMMEMADVQAPYVNGLLHGGHLGGTVPLHRGDVDSMHPSILPEGLWVADLSLLPRSQGLPTMLTTAALAMRVSHRIPM
ncbi:MAG TPA: FAD-dependent oxidoreductase [Methanomassiliicoccales archaeon]|jgi:choline dehydrogenase-like flavoprotein